jgi:hypothetical protein
MTAVDENLILERIRRIDGRLDSIQNDVPESKECLGHLQRGMAGLALPYGTTSTRVDRVDPRFHPIERRLDLADA